MEKELFINIDYTDIESTKIRISNFFNYVVVENIVDLTQMTLIDALNDTFSLYKAHSIQLAQEAVALKFKN